MIEGPVIGEDGLIPIAGERDGEDAEVGEEGEEETIEVARRAGIVTKGLLVRCTSTKNNLRPRRAAER